MVSPLHKSSLGTLRLTAGARKFTSRIVLLITIQSTNVPRNLDKLENQAICLSNPKGDYFMAENKESSKKAAVQIASITPFSFKPSILTE